MDSIRMYLDSIYEYEPASVPFKENSMDFTGSYVALDYKMIPDTSETIDLGLTEFHQATDYWYTQDDKEYPATLLILKKDWEIEFIEMKQSCMIIYLAHVSESKIELKLCLFNK